MSRTERDKGLKGEREVAAIYTARGFDVRGLEGTGDHLIVCDPASGLVLHSEVKRQETARVWAWWEQATSEAEAGSMPVVHFRRNRSRWLAIVDAEHLADLLAVASVARPRQGDAV
jgi:Holliday junction resolvase